MQPDLASPTAIPWTEVQASSLRGLWQRPPDDLAVSLANRLLSGSRILDVGHGAGRHLRYFRELGHRVVGIDPGPGQRSAVQEVMPDIELHPLQFDRPLPFPDGSFDAALSTYAIYHGTRLMVKHVWEEAVRVLRNGGLMYAHLISTNDFKYGVGPQIEPNTFLEVRPGEHGEMHHFFDLNEVQDFCSLFSRVDVRYQECALDPGPRMVASDWDRRCAHWIVKGEK